MTRPYRHLAFALSLSILLLAGLFTLILPACGQSSATHPTAGARAMSSGSGTTEERDQRVLSQMLAEMGDQPTDGRARESDELAYAPEAQHGFRAFRGGASGAHTGAFPDPDSGDPSVALGRDARIGQRQPGDPPARPSFVSAPGEEIWVITRPAAWDTPSDAKPIPGGALTCVRPNPDPTIEGTIEVPVPLEHTGVDAAVRGYIGTVRVNQRYTNPFSEKIEAVYTFPLPQDSAVDSFLMTIGDRTIRGIIREKEEAQQIYNEAKSRGHVASIMTQQRPNIFTQRVANIEPGKRIDIDIRYYHTLPYRDGAYEFTFPMTVGPRYNPSGTTTPSNIAYLTPNERSGHDISLTLDIDAGVPIANLISPTHSIRTTVESSTTAIVTLSPSDTLPNRDFVLRIGVAQSDLQSALLTHPAPNGVGGTFSIMLVPPQSTASLQRAPVEFVFVLDCSGSMRGEPLTQSKQAMRRALRSLQPGDSFQIIRFSSNASALGAQPLEATTENINKGLRYINQLEGTGGTQMIEGIKAALDFPSDDLRTRFVCFMTDGFIGNEAQILGTLHEKLADARVFSFGVGSSPNRYLLERMAKLGRGAVAYIGAGDDANTAMDLFFDRVSRPVLTQLTLLRPEGSRLIGVYPRQFPDLYAGRPVVLTGRYTGTLVGPLTLTATLAGEPTTLTIPIANPGEPLPELAALWARTRIADVTDEIAWTPNSQHRAGLTTLVTQLALDHNLMSNYTSFVAVDSLSTTQGNHGTTVITPVLVPEGVRYDTTVSPGAAPR